MTAKRFEFSVAVGGDELEVGEDWTPEHLVLAGLARCTLASLAHYAERAGVEVRASAGADAVVTRREEDGRYAFVEVLVGVDVELEGEMETERVAELLGQAEWGCFVGASLTVPPRYEWRVNGTLLST